MAKYVTANGSPNFSDVVFAFTTLDRNNTAAILQLGVTLLYLGQPEMALPNIEKALHLNPRYQNVFYYYFWLAFCHLLMAHTDEAIEFFRREGYMEQANAEREAMRGTADPGYLVYTLGKLQILKLRGDYKKKMGDAFKLKQFHDRFLGYGYPPIQMIREEMLGNNSPAL